MLPQEQACEHAPIFIARSLRQVQYTVHTMHSFFPRVITFPAIPLRKLPVALMSEMQFLGTAKPH